MMTRGMSEALFSLVHWSARLDRYWRSSCKAGEPEGEPVGGGSSKTLWSPLSLYSHQNHLGKPVNGTDPSPRPSGAVSLSKPGDSK